MKKIIHLRKQYEPKYIEPVVDVADVGGAIEPPKRASYDKVGNANTDKLKKLLRELQIEASGGGVKKNKTFTL